MDKHADTRSGQCFKCNQRIISRDQSLTKRIRPGTNKLIQPKLGGNII